MIKAVLLIKVRVNLMVALKLQIREALGILKKKKLHILKRNENRFGGATTRLKFFCIHSIPCRTTPGLVTCQYSSKNSW